MAERADASPRWMARRALKVALAGALWRAGAQRAVSAVRRREAGGRRVLLVSYHRVTHDFGASAREGLASLAISADTLARQIAQLARSWDVVSLADAHRILSGPPSPGPDAVAFTFDDGYADLMGVALPILERLRVPAAAFVCTGYVGTRRRLPHDRIFASLTELQRRGIPPERAALRDGTQALLSACAAGGPAATLDRLIARLPHHRLVAVADALDARVGHDERRMPPATRLLDWDEVRALHAAGLDVGGHTVHHAVLPNLAPARARREIEGCRDALAARLGRAPRFFAYPNGYHSAAVRRLVRNAGFVAAVTTEDRENVRGGDPLRLRRKMVWENTTLGPAGYSPALAACNLEGVFGALRLASPVGGERTDARAPRRGRAPGRAGVEAT